MKSYKYLFCFIIPVLLFLPFLFISKGEISIKENRGLYKFPSLLTEKRKINEKYGIELNKWFSDRFGGRQFFIDSRFGILYFLNNKIANKEAFLADDDWIFPTKGIKKLSSVDNQRKKIVKTAKRIKKINKYFDGKDIQIYLILEPSRSILYKKYWEKYYPYYAPFDYFKQLKEELKDYSNIHFIDLNDVFEENKNSIELYEKNDPHMTLSAVNIMLEQIISEFDKNMAGKNLFEQYQNSLEYKDKDCRLFTKRIYDDILDIKSKENCETCQEISIKNSRQKLIYDDAGIKETIVQNPYIDNDLFMLTICYGDFLYTVLGEFFSHTTVVNYNVLQEHKNGTKFAISKLKAIKPKTTILIFLSYPTEYNVSNSMKLLEAF